MDTKTRPMEEARTIRLEPMIKNIIREGCLKSEKKKKDENLD